MIEHLKLQEEQIKGIVEKRSSNFDNSFLEFSREVKEQIDIINEANQGIIGIQEENEQKFTNIIEQL